MRGRQVLDRPTIDAEFFLGSAAIEWGALTRKELREGPYRRIFHGVYVMPGVDITHELRCRACATICDPRAVVTGRSAATVHGVPLARAGDDVELVFPGKHTPQRHAGLRVRNSERLRATESVAWQGIRLATPLRAAFDLLLSMPIAVSVGGVDMMLRAGLVERDALTELVLARRDDGVVRARRACELLDPRAESPRESELRVLLRLAGIGFEPQVEIDLTPSWRVRADLARSAEKVIVEYDGAWHGGEAQVTADHRRRAALRSAGWTVLVYTDHDLRGDRAAIINQVTNAVTTSRRPFPRKSPSRGVR